MSKYYINPKNDDIALLTDSEAKEFYGYIPASNHLAALRAENAELREALTRIVKMGESGFIPYTLVEVALRTWSAEEILKREG